MKKYNYTPNRSARNLKLADTKTIAVLIKGIDNSFFKGIIKVFEEEIKKQGYTFLLYKVDILDDEIDVAFNLIKEKKLSGIIFLGGNFIENDELSKKIKIPFVLTTVAITDSLKSKNYSFVSVDDEYESFRIIDYLCKTGYKKIAIIKSLDSDMSIGYLRFSGYKKALHENNIAFDKNICFSMQENIVGYSMENGYEVMKKIIQSENFHEIDAVYCISDTIAVGACRAIHEANLKIPEDISVVGFDGIEMTKYFIPKITTMAQPADKIAKKTIDILFKSIKNKSYTDQKIYKCELFVGESVDWEREVFYENKLS